MLYYRKTKTKQKTEIEKLEVKLWEIFSVFIRLRDTDKNGYGKCFTCPRIIHWSKGDAGHGIPRQHKATKFSECNNNLQCKHCNGFEGGMREVYKVEMDKKYGAQTWDKILVASKGTIHFSVPLLKNNIEYYSQKVEELKTEKGML
jgi:hypothetical protein